VNGRSWAIVLAVLCGFATACVALFADLSEGAYLVRVSIGLLVGALVGLGFDALILTAGSRNTPAPVKGRMVDFTLNEAPPADEFVPTDLTKATRVIQQMVREE
jgi:hypothetical protein